MTQARLKEILLKYVTYLYPSVKVSDEIDITIQDYTELMDDGSINIRGDIHSLKGYNIRIEQPFVPEDNNLLNHFITEVNIFEGYTNLSREYMDNLIQSALDHAIASTLSSTSQVTVSKAINALTKFAERTYEGRKIRYGIIINDKLSSDTRSDNIYFADYLSSPYSAVLTNGTESFVEVDSQGYLIRYLQLNTEKIENGLAPYDYTRILEYAGEDTIAIILSTKGEILIFHNNELKYTKRGGRWNPYSHESIIQIIHQRSENDNRLFAKAVYLTALDVSFASTGGIISFLDENKVENALRYINIHDIVNERYFLLKREEMKETNDPEYEDIKNLTFEEFLRRKENGKSCVLNRMIDGRKFFKLYRKLRAELVGIDGATVIDYNGDIVAIGAIVKIEAGSVGGGRLAAAKTLSHYGIALEISSDSSVKAFALDEDDVPEAIFTISDIK